MGLKESKRDVRLRQEMHSLLSELINMQLDGLLLSVAWILIRV